MPALANLLAQDAISWSDGGGKVQSALRPIRGQSAVARFWIGLVQKNQRSFSPMLEEVNGSPALLIWGRCLPGPGFRVHGHGGRSGAGNVRHSEPG